MDMIANSKNIIQNFKKSEISFPNYFPSERCWYAVYTRPRHEKKVYAQLQKEKIEAFLPLYTTIHQWSDRKKKVLEPLFSCYIFVCISTKAYYSVLNISSVIRFVSFEGRAISIPDSQIRLIKNMLAQDMELIEAPKFLPLGSRVEIVAGLLAGASGVLVDIAGKKRVIIYIDEIEKSFYVNIPLNYLKQVSSS
jgi:transcriptional antiterminator RfaH